MTPRFVHLHLHSEYSLTDSTIRIPELVGRCAALGMPAVAVTDTSSFRLVPGWAMTCWKPLTVWPLSARAFGNSSGGI